jgi:potassium/sodium efflux P-type ATPase
MVFKGTAVTQGVGSAIVTATGMDSEMGRISRMLQTTVEDPTPLQKEITRLGKVLGIAVVVIAVIVVATTFAVFRVDTAGQAVTLLLLGVSLAVAAVPEGLPAILSVVLAIGVQRMAARKAIVKKLSSAETLGSASVICSDKTGTLTKSEMTIGQIITASGEVALTGVGYRPEGRAEVAGQEITDSPLLTEARLVLGGGSLAGNSSLRERDGVWEIQGDPTEAAFLVAARKLKGTQELLEQFERRGEIPFTSERKRMSTLQHNPGNGHVTLFSKGAPDVLLRTCTGLRVGEEVIPLDDARRAAALAAIDKLSAQAFRTLGVAYRRIEDNPGSASTDGGALDESMEKDFVYVGVVGIIDPPRPEAAVAVAEARRAGVRVIMITGDHPLTATRIAADLGIVEPGAQAITGMQLDGLDEAGFRETVRKTSVYARVAPEHKLQIVDALQADGNIVAMTGDGVNDAPALKTADIGVAMGITGTDVTKEAGNMILADDNFATIVAAVREGRGIFDNIKKFLRYLLGSNMGEVFTVFFGVVLAQVIGLTSGNGAIVLPLLATQLLWINLVTDSAPAMALGMDPETEDVMARPPRKTTERVIDGRMWSSVLMLGLVMAVMTLLTIDILLPGGFVEGTSSLDVARTAGFTVLVFAQMFNVFNARSANTSAFHQLFVNRWLLGAVVLGVLLQVLVVQVPLMNAAFSTAPLTVWQWTLCALMASAVLWVDEVRKLIWRAMHRPTAKG